MFGFRALEFRVCRPQINTIHPVKGLNVRIPIIIPINGRGFIDYGSTLGVGGGAVALVVVVLVAAVVLLLLRL